MNIDLEQTARDDLAQWGLSMRPQYLPYYQSTPCNAVKLDVYGNALTISEEYACELDAVISGLKLYDEKSHKAAKLYFCNAMSYRAIATVLNVNRNAVAALVDNAVSWVARGVYDKKCCNVA